MFALAALAPAVTDTERLFTVPAPFLPWLAPACILAGIALQLGALACPGARKKPLGMRSALVCAGGALLVLTGAALDRDVTVAVGEALALGGIRFAWRNG
ncbi:MAG: hypothetical protein HDR50_00855 [Desulfovibrio sp.]|uniref:hypothetical protein n=1 Tax=Desulfovibrio sp. TaxID=885 RepID=UPI001A6C578B|nr:hypothetical protein [Desulfovibrio sp.]MBD5416241.1 hypothetical protein [Desulfovibrio sp.]